MAGVVGKSQALAQHFNSASLRKKISQGKLLSFQWQETVEKEIFIAAHDFLIYTEPATS